MNLSRRGFLGGAIAAITLRILPSPLAAREPRKWIWLQFHTGFDPNCTRAWARWAACRSDGVYFTTAGPIFLEDVGTSSMESSPAVLAVKQQTRILLNEFLDSRCDCHPGYWCQIHEHMRPKDFSGYIPDDEDEDEEDTPTAIYEVVSG